MNVFKGIDSASLCRLAGRFDNPIPTRFLVLVCGIESWAPYNAKIPALVAKCHHSFLPCKERSELSAFLRVNSR